MHVHEQVPAEQDLPWKWNFRHLGVAPSVLLWGEEEHALSCCAAESSTQNLLFTDETKNKMLWEELKVEKVIPALSSHGWTGSRSEEGVRGDGKESLMEKLMGLQCKPPAVE